MNDVNDVPAPTPRQAPRRHAPAGAAFFALFGLLAGGCANSGPEETMGPAAESREVHLQPVGAAGPEPFTASSATAESAPVQPPLPNTSGRGIRTVGAATPGLYGGTHRLGSCDVERQVNSLTADDAKAQAFAQASGIEKDKLPEFLRGLTPVVLRADTRVTNHAFRDGRPGSFQSVLQAGTAVLVDDHGMPRVRCACGNPLVAPRAPKGSAVHKGEPWNGYQPNQVIVIEPTAQVIDNLVIVNIADNTWIERRAGDDGAQDQIPKALPPYDPAEGIPNGPAIQPESSPSEPCATADSHSLARTTPPAPPSRPSSGVPGPAAAPCPPSPSSPQREPRSDAPSDLGSDVPSTVPEDGPPDPSAQLPDDPALPPDGGDAPLQDPDAPGDPALPDGDPYADPYTAPDADPYGVPDQQEQSFDEGPDLESA
ncbi:DUF6777 domain-containing protein [Streptomyces sp. NPDC003042]